MMSPTDPRVPAPLALRGRNVVCISSIDWDFLWQGHHEIMSRLARAGNHVVFVENTGVRSIRAADLGRVVRRLRLSLVGRRTVERAAGGIQVVSPLLLPWPRWAFARTLNQRILLPRLARHIRSLGASRPILFTYLPTPNALRLIQLLREPTSRVIYYCVADFQELADPGARLDTCESRLAEEADLIFVQTLAFRDRFAAHIERVHEFSGGVNLEVFDRQATTPSAELSSLPRPLLGYSGGVHQHIDLGILSALADRFPHGSLVIVGELQMPLGSLGRRKNVHVMGKRQLADLPALLACFDVGLIPYVRSRYTETVFPTKLYEYLAMGLPVVSSDLPELRRQGFPAFAVRLATDPDAFLEAVALSVGGSDDPSHAARRAALAGPRDWRLVVSQMAELLAGDGSDRLGTAPP